MYILLVEKKLIFFFIDKSIIFYTIDNKMEKPYFVFVPVRFVNGDTFKLPVCGNQTAQMVAKAFTKANPNIKFTINDVNDIITVVQIKNDSNECPYGVRCFNENCEMNHPVGHDLNKAIAARQARLDKTTIDCKYSRCTNSKCPYRHRTVPGGAASGGAASGGAASGDAASGGAASGGRGRGCE